MTVINSALALKIDGAGAVRAYMDGVVVWPSGTGNTLVASIAKVSGQAKVTVSAGSSGIVPDQYKYYLSTNGGAWTFKADTAATSVTISTSYSTRVKARVEAFKSGLLLNTALSGEITTDAAPPPPTLQKVATLSRTAFASYKGTGVKRTDSDGVTYGFSGYYSSNHGNQKSSFLFAIPADLRNCKSVDKVEVSIYNIHAYYNTGRSVQLALHHGDLSSWGSTATFWAPSAGKPGWVGGAEWIDITNYTCPGRYTVKEEFRVWGARGITMNQGPSTSQSYYGYVRNDVRLRFTYTVYT